MARNQFASKIGLVAATVGSAVGLGNIWRFPAETQANGGAAFLLLYIICIFVLGVPVMLAEFSLGRGSRCDTLGAFKKFAPGTPWWLLGAMAIAVPYIITCFYMVVEGWTVEYLWESITGGLYADGGDQNAFSERMVDYINADWPPILFTWIVLLVNGGVLLGGVQKGIERLSNVLMPLLFVVLLVLCVVSLCLPGAADGVRWFLAPDFSQITFGTVINAMGQAFFSLSLCMGILITYSSYYPDSTRLARTSVIVVLMSMLVAVLVGLVIFPAVANFGLQDHSLRGTTLVFQTLPEVFALMPGTWLWSVLFFVLIFVAALTSTVSLLEVSVAFLRDRFGFSRVKAVVSAIVPMFVLSALCSLSFGSLSEFKILGYTLFDFLDYFATNLMLPLVGIGTCIFVGWVAPRDLLGKQLSNNGELRTRFAGLVLFVVRYVAPLIIAAILVSNLG